MDRQGASAFHPLPSPDRNLDKTSLRMAHLSTNLTLFQATSKVLDFLDGGCNWPNEKKWYVLKKCTSILLGLLEVPRINNCLTMLADPCVVGPKDK